jgi:hypothetical protein
LPLADAGVGEGAGAGDAAAESPATGAGAGAGLATGMCALLNAPSPFPCLGNSDSVAQETGKRRTNSSKQVTWLRKQIRGEQIRPRKLGFLTSRREQPTLSWDETTI